MLKVCKFGGSSVAGAEQFRKVRDIVLSDDSRRVVVISAAGKRTSDDHKLTDLLYLCHAHLTYGVSCADILAAIRSRFVSIRDELGLSYRVEDEFDAYAATLSRDTSVDELVSRGEYFTARLMAETLGYAFVDAADCVFFGFDGQFDRARTDAAIADALEKNGKIVLPGFYGRVPTGKIKVMTRGGSDITGALAAAAVNADVYENWTDVSGILMADPRIVDDPRPIPRITYAELREMAFMGASVLHEESILPVKEKGISLNIRNTNRPDEPGTFIVEHIESESELERPITGIAGRRNFTILTVLKRNMNASTRWRSSTATTQAWSTSRSGWTASRSSFRPQRWKIRSMMSSPTFRRPAARTMCACRTASRSSPPWAAKCPPAPARPASSSRRSASTG